MIIRKYIYYVKVKVGSASWLDNYFVICDDVDKILPMFFNSGMDNTDAYGKPREPRIQIHSIQKFAMCGNDDTPDQFIEMVNSCMYCDIIPNSKFY